METIRGRAWCYGDNIDTDLIIPGKYLKLTAREAAPHVMEGIDPGFSTRIRPGDLVVAGRNFGAGSSREYAPACLKLVGVGAVIACSFARIFFRNSINVGFPAIECPEAGQIQTGDELEVELEAGIVRNIARGSIHQATPFSGHLLTMMSTGGLVPYLENLIRTGELKPAPPPPSASG